MDSIKNIGNYIEQPLLIFDLETTGLDVEKSEIVEFCGVLIFPGGKSKTLTFRCKTKEPISSGAYKVHGISEKDLDQCLPFEKHAETLVKWLPSEPFNIGGYNVLRFDLPILDRQLREHNKDDVFKGCYIIDCFELYRKHQPRNLAQAHIYYTGEKMKDAHTAVGDTFATCRILASQLQIESKESLQNLACSSPSKRANISAHLEKNTENKVVFAFGKYKGRPVEEVDRGYLEWLLKRKFPKDFKEYIRSILTNKNDL